MYANYGFIVSLVYLQLISFFPEFALPLFRRIGRLCGAGIQVLKWVKMCAPWRIPSPEVQSHSSSASVRSRSVTQPRECFCVEMWCKFRAPYNYIHDPVRKSIIAEMMETPPFPHLTTIMARRGTMRWWRLRLACVWVRQRKQNEAKIGHLHNYAENRLIKCSATCESITVRQMCSGCAKVWPLSCRIASADVGYVLRFKVKGELSVWEC